MPEKKSAVIYIIIAAVAIFIIFVVGVIFLLSRSNPNSAATTTGQPNQAAVQLPAEPAAPQLLGVNKDSVLRSVDSGLNFETYFLIATDKEKELGEVDALSMVFYPDTADRIVVTTYDDGLFFNQNKVNQWFPIEFPHQKIYSFILDKKNPEARSFASGVVSGNGRIFRTNDGGKTWRAVYAEPGNNTYVSAITQDPVNNNIIIAGTNAGTLVRSIDGGDTWKNIGQTISGNISQFAHDSSKPAFAYLLEKGGKVYYSSDAGVTWLNWEEEKTKEIKNLNDRANELYRDGNKDGSKYLKDQAAAIQLRNKTEKVPTGIISLTPDPNVSGVLYASLSKGLYRSTDYGKYWKPINIIESAEKFPIPSVAVNPNNSNEISFVAGNSFYRSINYGLTWSVTPLDKTRNASFVAYDPFNPGTIYIGLSAKK